MEASLVSLSQKVLRHYKAMEELYVRRGGEGNPITPVLDAYAKMHPEADVWQLKAAQYRLLSETVTPVIFDESPFYFVTDLFFRDGTPRSSAGGWLQNRNRHLFRDADPETYDFFDRFKGDLRAFSCCGPYADQVHFCFPVEHVVKWGLRGALERVQAAMDGASGEELRFLACAQEGLYAARRLCERFRQAAIVRRRTLTDPAAIRNMDLLIAASAHAPWEPCETFLEGLNTMWFCRNVLGAMDGIGNSHLGRPDVILPELYRLDLAAGRITEEEALYDVKQFVIFGDKHYDREDTVKEGADQELEMGLVLGGCDKDGVPVYNEITRMFLRAHREVNAIYPKLHCRIAENAPREYLEELARDYMAGRSVIGLSYDSGYLPALLHDGLTLEDARSYVNTGCWSSISEGNESVPGGNYLYLVKLLEKTVYGAEPEFHAAGIDFAPMDDTESFDELYHAYVGNVCRVIRWRDHAIGTYGPLASTVNPLALSSAFLTGCVESRRDFTQGGAKYNRNTVDIAGFANAIDALLAMKALCFDEKLLTPRAYLDAVRSNWVGHEELLRRVRACPHYGDLREETVRLTRRLQDDLYNSLAGEKNERGGNYNLNFYVYREFILDAKSTRATPDGRRDGELYALGLGPSRYHPADPLTNVVQTAGGLDPTHADVTALDLQLPLGQMTVEKLGMLLRVFGTVGLKHLQINVVDADTLLDAQKHPEQYPDLMVRVCGFSAKFTSLAPYFQEEVIHRAIYETA